MKNKLKYRTLTSEAKEILMSYLLNEIDYLTAHNKLIVLGINFTENEELLDY